MRQLGDLGLCHGDAVLARVDFGKMGRVQRPADRTLIESLLAVVGDRGTVMAVTHSPVQWVFRRTRSYVFDPATAPTVTGRFAACGAAVARRLSQPASDLFHGRDRAPLSG